MTDVTASTPANEVPLHEEPMVDEQQVVDYLLANPQFFIHHPQILSTIRLPHQERGAVSLVERQQELLRNKVQVLEEEITTLMSIARQNEGIFLTFSQLYLQLLSSDDEATLYDVMLETLSEKLGLPAIYLKRFADDETAFHINRHQAQRAARTPPGP